MGPEDGSSSLSLWDILLKNMVYFLKSVLQNKLSKIPEINISSGDFKYTTFGENFAYFFIQCTQLLYSIVGKWTVLDRAQERYCSGLGILETAWQSRGKSRYNDECCKTAQWYNSNVYFLNTAFKIMFTSETYTYVFGLNVLHDILGELVTIFLNFYLNFTHLFGLVGSH